MVASIIDLEISVVSFRTARARAHREGVKDGQALFSKYMPEECVNMLKKTENWEMPYKYAKPDGYKVVNGQLPKDFNKLSKSFAHASASLEDLESHCSEHKEELESKGVDEEEEISVTNVNNRDDQGNQREQVMEKENKN